MDTIFCVSVIRFVDREGNITFTAQRFDYQRHWASTPHIKLKSTSLVRAVGKAVPQSERGFPSAQPQTLGHSFVTP
jgi:hypothetical protein